MAANKLILKKKIGDAAFYLNRFLGCLNCPGKFRVLMYHSISDGAVEGDHYQMTVPKQLFEEQMRFLEENSYSVMPCGDLVNTLEGRVPLPPKAVFITFDDGFKDNLINAAPILEKHKFTATIFLPVNFIGNDKNRLNWDEACELAKGGIFSFGSHSVSHQKLRGLDRRSLEKEIGLSREILEKRLRMPIELFAYPFGCYGSFDEQAVDVLRSKGYKAGFTTISGWNTMRVNPYLIRRTRISWVDEKEEFSKELQGAYDWYSMYQRLSSICGNELG